MPTTGIINGKLLRLYDGSNTIGNSTEASLSITTETRDTSNKDSGGFRELLPGLISGSLSASAFMAFDATHGFEELVAKQLAGTAITWKMSTEVSADHYLSGSAYITSIEINAPNEENTTLSISLETTGTITAADVV